MMDNFCCLNLGCGNKKILGYIGIDNSPMVRPDLLIDLEKPTQLGKYFPKNSVDKIVCNHVLEHIHNFIPLMKMLHRLCKSGAKIYVRTPFHSAWGQFNDPTHVRFFSLHTFDYFNKSNYSHETETDKDMFDLKVKLNFAIGRLSFLNWFMNPIINLWQEFYCRFLAFIIPCSEIKYELTCIK